MSESSSPHTRTKVAVLIGTLEVGGAELDIVRNFPRLNRDEFDVVVVTFAEPGALAPELERQGIRVVSRREPWTGTATSQSAPAVEAEAVEWTEPRWYTLYSRFVLSLPVSLRNAVHPAKEALKRAVSGTRAHDSETTERRSLLDLRWVGWVLRKLSAAAYIARVTRWIGHTLRDERVDIVHSFLPHSYVYGMYAARFWRPRAKSVMSRLSLNFYADAHPTIAWQEQHVLHKRLDIAIGNSKMILDELAEEGVDRSKLRLLHNGIDPTPYMRREADRALAREALGISPDAFVLVTVGNLHPYKGHIDLIEACALAQDRLPDGWRLLMAGRDQVNHRAVLEARIEQLGLAEHVTLLGACDAVPQLLHAADIFVHPSHHEGLPNAIIEAMAASLPVIGTTVGGIPEAVAATSNGSTPAVETGWLVPPSDPVALAEALAEAASDAHRREHMGQVAAARVVAEFSLDRSVSAYEAIYRELMR